jgi:mevalonate kinase
MNRQNASYYAKLLLFGEYSILLGSSALSIPYSHFRAEFSFIQQDKYTDMKLAVESRQLLKELLENLEWTGNYASILDLPRFRKDIEAGMYLESTIPQSYGLGSSGAVVAAVYDRYALTTKVNGKMSTKVMEDRCKQFAGIESFFHGTSSGIDPLTIYIGQPLFFDSKQKPTVVGIPRKWQNENTAIFLVDTGCPGKTNPLVSAFLNRFAPNGSLTTEARSFVHLTDQCIHHLLNGSIADFWQSLKTLSLFQLDQMRDMIPAAMHEIWKNGMESGSLILKLCGSGGGGYLTAFTQDQTKALQFIKDNKLQHIPVYISTI